MTKYKHLFFDLDRTLWDFDKNCTETLSELIDEFLLSTLIDSPDDFIRNFYYYNEHLWDEYREGKIKKFLLRRERFRLLLNHYGIKKKDLVDQVSKFYLDKYPVKTALIAHAKEITEYLASKYKLHIITNGFYDAQLTKLINSGISRYFAKIFTSDRIGHAKPDTNIFEYAVRSIHAHKQECIMIGDDITNDIIGARNANIDQVFYNPTCKAISFEPTFEIRSLLELKELF